LNRLAIFSNPIISGKIFFILLIITLVLLFGMNSINSHLINDQVPNGIVSLELAGSITNAELILASWDKSAQFQAGLSMGLDFLFLIAYSITIALGCLLVIKNSSIFIQKIGLWLAVSQFLAAGLDVIENLAMIKLLAGSTRDILPAIAYRCAIPKFIIILAGLVFLLAGALKLIFIRLLK